MQRGLAERHARLVCPVSLDLIQQLAGEVASVALGKEPYWRYEPVTPPARASVIALGYDGTCTQTREEGWKQLSPQARILPSASNATVWRAAVEM